MKYDTPYNHLLNLLLGIYDSSIIQFKGFSSPVLEITKTRKEVSKLLEYSPELFG